MNKYDYIFDVSNCRLLTEKSSFPKNMIRHGGPFEPHLFFNETVECEKFDFCNTIILCIHF